MINSPSINITEVVKSNLLNLFDEKVGIVSEARELGAVLVAPLYGYYASTKFDGHDGCNGCATAMDRDTALSKAIGEGLERYCLSAYDHKPFIQTRRNSLFNKYECLDPKQTEIYTLDELTYLSFQQYSDSLETLFCIAYNVAKSRYQYIPFSLVYLRSSFFERHPNLNIIQQTISTGAAFGIEFYQTALTGLYEVIERDAVMAYWILGQPKPRIDLETLNSKQKSLIAQIEKNDVTLHLFDISVDDGIFVILSCLKSENPTLPAIVFSSSADLSFDTAVQKALEEVVSTFALADLLLRKNPNGFQRYLYPNRWDIEVVERDDHVLFWSYHEIFQAFGSQLDFIFKSHQVISREKLLCRNQYFKTNKEAFFSIISNLYRKDYETFLVDISNSDISSLGFMTLKTIIPGYLPLYLGHRFAYYSTRRLSEIAKTVYHLDLSKITLNRLPHPFP